jgi:predicted transcriptional regulator
MNEILQYLKTHGEQLDAEIAQAVGMSLINVRKHLDELTAKGEIMSYQSTKFENGKKVEGIRCRIAGFIPLEASGKKSKVQLRLS